MTEFSDICEYLARNPMANNLIAFLDLYELMGSKFAYNVLFSSLTSYTLAVKDNDTSNQLLIQLSSIAVNIGRDKIDLVRLQPLYNAISGKKNEVDILQIALVFAQNPPQRIDVKQKSR
ncbi:BgTH12-02579 [Blumeria graminis f. sp. triticale]|uniref:BgtAc-31136 n=3 Tax=Blumeria graminis TaxID=34373 RepID=A0A9X9QDH9_BLUGR|nr:hypothetical protein BGT96224_Ac31136 [Blumeria graminis f. sp. tritici 96224]CAD6502905.1 BgTH12-02579 [Blumeria graminis f. sp. triticale]VDB88712.1 BgtAc-31136 [Blumeria graminis f. sp. tritici]